jgi:hypothetical protein
VGHKERGDQRILVPTRANYESVLKVPTLMQSEQLIVHMIYDNARRINEICNSIRNVEYMEGVHQIIEEVYSNTRSILALTDPNAFCSRVAQDELRYFSPYEGAAAPEGAATADTVFARMPGFLQNFIKRAVQPEMLQIDTEELRLRNCPTCRIDSRGLVAEVDGVQLYNPIKPNDIIRFQPNRLQVRNVLKFEGDTRSLAKTLSYYEEYPLEVPLYLGRQIISSDNNLLRANYFLPTLPPVLARGTAGGGGTFTPGETTTGGGAFGTATTVIPATAPTAATATVTA